MLKGYNWFLLVLCSFWGFCLWSYPLDTVFNNMSSHISALHLYSMFDDISWQLETTRMTVFYHWQALYIWAFLPNTESAFVNIYRGSHCKWVFQFWSCKGTKGILTCGEVRREMYRDLWGSQAWLIRKSSNTWSWGVVGDDFPAGHSSLAPLLERAVTVEFCSLLL